jgi:hypothetical protein
MTPIEISTYFSRALELPAAFGAAFLLFLTLLLSVAMAVALFAKDDKRAGRAYKIFVELLRVLQRRSK